MDIYKHKVDDIRKDIASFSKGAYGRTVFLLAFTPSLIILIITLTIEFLSQPGNAMSEHIKDLPLLILAIMFSFILGNIYYYKELRNYATHKQKLELLYELKQSLDAVKQQNESSKKRSKAETARKIKNKQKQEK